MVKQAKQFVCGECGFTTPRWQGKCPECGQWNTFGEQTIVPAAQKGGKRTANTPVKLSEVQESALNRLSTGLPEFDMVLGGGIVPGALMLLGGDPGIGKSTLALQVAMYLENAGKKVMYVSGEESAQQIKLRKSRISQKQDLTVLPETNLEVISASLEAHHPDFAVIDSVQTITSELANGVVGGVSQITFITNHLMRLAKQLHIAILIIGHVTKEGMLAGPKTLEHMVDTVLYLEGERFTTLRLLRCNKNRFGSTGEVGVFEMHETGLTEVKNPSLMFLDEAHLASSGNCLTAILQGNKVLILEVQALTTPTSFGYPRRTASGFDINRLQLLIAILQKRLGVKLSEQDVYINVAGGFKLDERAADLPVALAILSSLHNVALPKNMVAFGEIGLAGEIRSVIEPNRRIKELEKLGFNDVVLGGKALATSSPSKDRRSFRELKDLTGLFRKRVTP